MFLLLTWFAFVSADAPWVVSLKQAEAMRVAHRYGEAEAAYAEALRVARQPNAEPEAIATVMNNTGFFHHEAGRLVDAERCYRSAYLWFAAHRTQYFVVYLRVMTNLAAIFSETDQWQKSEALLRPSLQLVAPGYEADLARLRGIYASILAQQGKFAEAEPILAEVRTILEQEPLSHFQQETLALTISNQGWLYQSQHRAPEALPFYRQALALLEPLADSTPLTLSRTLRESALALAKVGQKDTALAQYQRALTLATHHLAPSHHFLATLHRDYAQLLRQLHRRREAKREESLAKSIWQKHAQENLVGYTVDAKSFR